MTATDDWTIGDPTPSWRVFPVRGKVPALEGDWRKHSSRDPATIRGWLAAGYGLALDCGASGVFVVDLDPGAPAFEASTYAPKTPRGQHFYFQGVGPTTTGRLAPHTDTRGVGGYVVIYDQKMIAAVGEGQALPALSPIPEAVAAKLAEVSKTRTKAAIAADADLVPHLQRAATWLANRNPAVEGAGGDDWTYKTIQGVIDLVPTEDPLAVAAAMDGWNARCSPAWDDDELLVKVENAFSYRQNDVGAWAVAPVEQRFAGAAAAITADTGEALQVVTFKSDTAPARYTLRQVLMRRAKPIEEILPGFFVKGVTNLFAGPSKTMKSRLALQTPLMAALEMELLAARQMPKSAGVYVSYEDDIEEVTRRVHAMCDVLAVTEEREFLEDMVVFDAQVSGEPIAYIDEDSDIRTTPFGRRLLAEIGATAGHKIVSVDSFDNAFVCTGMAKMQQGPINTLFRWLDRQCAALDFTLIPIWHPSTAGNRDGDVMGYSPAFFTAPRVKITMTLATTAELRKARLSDSLTAYKLFAQKRSGAPDGATAFLVYDRGILREATQLVTAPETVHEPPAVRKAVFETMRRLLTQDPPIQVVRGSGRGGGWGPKEVINAVASDHPGMILSADEVRAAQAALEVPNAATGEPPFLGYRNSGSGGHAAKAGFYLLGDEAGDAVANELSLHLVYAALAEAGAVKLSLDGRPARTVGDEPLASMLAKGDPTLEAAFLPDLRRVAKLPEYAHLLAKRATGRGTNAWQVQDEW